MKNNLKELIKTIIVLGEESLYLRMTTGISEEELIRYQDVQTLLKEYQRKIYLEVLGNFIQLSDYIRRGVVMISGNIGQETLIDSVDKVKFEYSISSDTITALVGILETEPDEMNRNQDIVVRIRLNPILYES